MIKYTKLFAKMYEGSMRGKSDLLLVFPYMLCNSEADGTIDQTPKCMADALGISLERTLAALHELESPDPLSRTPDEDGRRIVLLDPHRDWGWRIVNREKYWNCFGDEKYREKGRARQERFRKRHGDGSGNGAGQDAHIPSLEEVITQGQFANVDEATCRSFFSYHNDNNYWLNRNGDLINWPDKLVSWKVRDEQRKSAGGVGGNGHINPVAQKLAIEEQLAKHPANRDSAFYRQDATDLEKANYREMRKKLRDLTALIALGGSPA